MQREMAIWLGGAAWLGLVVAGFWGWQASEQTPGSAAEPAAGDTSPASGSWALTIYVHPYCPCTRATLAELDALLAEAPVRPEAEVVVVRPDDAPAGWEQDGVTELRERNPGARVRVDGGGGEARRAGAASSGCVVLADPAGRVVFRGGITRGRGQTGKNDGRRAVLALLRGGPPGPPAGPVFGCPLFTTPACDDQGGAACRP